MSNQNGQVATVAPTVVSLTQEQLNQMVMNAIVMSKPKRTSKAPRHEFKPVSERSEFKGNRMITLKPYTESKSHFEGMFSIGLSKARLIVALIDDIRKFVADNPTTTESK